MSFQAGGHVFCNYVEQLRRLPPNLLDYGIEVQSVLAALRHLVLQLHPTELSEMRFVPLAAGGEVAFEPHTNHRWKGLR